MAKRTTIGIDVDLLARAKRALGYATTRATVEEALRRVAVDGEQAQDERATRQRRYLERFSRLSDLDALASKQMWR